MQTLPLTDDAQHLDRALNSLQYQVPNHRTGETFHVDGVGGTLYFAYEQLRNAAEYSEQHLLMRRAIERFLQRTFNFNRVQPLAGELVIELTQARYVKNDSVSRGVIKDIDVTLQEFAKLYQDALHYDRNREQLRRWVTQTASVHLEQMLAPHSYTRAFTDFAYGHYFRSINSDLSDGISPQQYEVSLYCAVNRAIMKSDMATTRAYALSGQILRDGPDNPAAYFVALNRMIDQSFSSKLTNQLVRLISQHGAPMRVLREIVLTQKNVPELLASRNRMLDQVRSTTLEQFKQVRERLNSGIVRSVAFIAITKMVIGLGLEIPYDLVRHGEIVWRPLIINLLFPPLYMATLGLSVRPPSRKNVDLIEEAVDRILYQTDKPPVSYRLRRRVDSPALNGIFNTLYGLTFILWMGALVWILHALDFNLVSGIIFFVFLSTVSFLGFRLTQTAREFEMIEARRGTLGFIADFFYTPFIRIGYWLSDTYAKINVVSYVLDILIEMPMKYVLRFLQQWVSFLRDKQEEL